MSGRRKRTVFTKDQLKVLIETFNKTPYPDYITRQNLALEMDIDESRIQCWFQNRRERHRAQEKSEAAEHLGGSRNEYHPVERSQGREDRYYRTSYSFSQLHTLASGFVNSPYPGTDSREQLAQEVGVPESRVYIWLQNQRSRWRVQRSKEPDEPLEQEQDQELATGEQCQELATVTGEEDQESATAVGEQDQESAMAVGEQDQESAMATGQQDQESASAMAVGEQDQKLASAMAMAMGEQDQESAMAVGEQEQKSALAMAMAMGEQDQESAMAVGEQDQKSASAMAMGEQDQKSAMAMGEQDRNLPQGKRWKTLLPKAPIAYLHPRFQARNPIRIKDKYGNYA
ncbi:uncharacterized protein AAES06_003369 isoform 2-T2 [Glossophaga mutica]